MPEQTERTSRRDFLARTTAASTGLLILKPQTALGYQANSAVRFGLLGCGRRGTAVATSFSKFSESGVFSDNLAQADSEKDKAFLESIETGNFHNQIATGVESAGSAMLARMSARHDQLVTWDDLLSTDEEYKLGMDLNQFA